MNWSDIGKTIIKDAPLVGTLLGGPVGAGVTTVGALVSSALGVANTPEAVAQELSNNPDAQVKIVQIESDQKVQLAKIAADQAVAQAQVDSKKYDDEVADRTSARQMQATTKSYTPSVLSYFIVAGLILACAAIVLGYSKGDSSLLGIVVGALLKETSQVIAYWFGGGLLNNDSK